MTKSVRIFEMIDLISESPGKLDVKELSALLSISERGIYRDLNTLSQAGVTVKINGRGGGYVLMSDHWHRFLGKRKLLGSMAKLLEIGVKNCKDKKLLKQGQRVLKSLGAQKII